MANLESFREPKPHQAGMLIGLALFISLLPLFVYLLLAGGMWHVVGPTASSIAVYTSVWLSPFDLVFAIALRTRVREHKFLRRLATIAIACSSLGTIWACLSVGILFLPTL